MLGRKSKAAALAVAVCGLIAAAHPERARRRSAGIAGSHQRSRCSTGPASTSTPTSWAISTRSSATTSNIATADYLSSLTTGLTNGDIDVIMEEWDTTAQEAMRASDATGQDRASRQARPQGQGRVVVPDLHEGEVPGPAELGGAEGSEMRRRRSPRRKPRPRAAISAGPVTWERIRRRARQGARPAVRRSCMPAPTPRCSPNCSRPRSARRRSCCGSIRRTGRQRSTRANGCSSRNTRRNATSRRSITAASRTARSGSMAGPE